MPLLFSRPSRCVRTRQLFPRESSWPSFPSSIPPLPLPPSTLFLVGPLTRLRAFRCLPALVSHALRRPFTAGARLIPSLSRHSTRPPATPREQPKWRAPGFPKSASGSRSNLKADTPMAGTQRYLRYIVFALFVRPHCSFPSPKPLLTCSGTCSPLLHRLLLLSAPGRRGLPPRSTPIPSGQPWHPHLPYHAPTTPNDKKLPPATGPESA